MMVSSLLLVLGLSATAIAQEPTPDVDVEKATEDKLEAWQTPGWGWGALPAVNYNSDEGFGFGALGSYYKYDGETKPYKWSATLLLFMTTQRIHSHYLDVDVLKLAGGRLRLTGRAQFSATRAENYCGVGAYVTCDPAEAEDKADELSLTGDERDVFLRRYYKSRYLNPRGYINARWKLSDMPHRVELFGGVRYQYLRPGDLTEKTVWENTKYAQDFPNGETGHLAVTQAGIMADNRDNEPAPNTGYWIEASGRVGAGDWTYAGFNVTLRGYVPLAGGDRLVLADRFMFDGMFGDAPTVEQNWFGGFQFWNGFGGLNAGRGIRQRRYRGLVMGLNQTELRWKFLKANIMGDTALDLTLLGFGDLAYTQEDWQSGGRILPGTGGGLRVAINQNFIVRADVGVSPLEDWAPSTYIDLRHLF